MQGCLSCYKQLATGRQHMALEGLSKMDLEYDEVRLQLVPRR